MPSIRHALLIIWTSIREANGLSFGSMANQVDEFAILHIFHIPCIRQLQGLLRFFGNLLLWVG